MRKVKYLVEFDGEDNADIRVEDGGVAHIYHNGEHLITEYYQDRDTNKEVDWEKLSEGKKYLGDWVNLHEVSEEMIQDAINWLYVSSGDIEFVKVDTIEELFNLK